MNTEIREKIEHIYRIIDSKKVENIEILDVEGLTTLAEVFVIVVGTNTRQTRALADELDFKMGQLGMPAYQKEGQDTSTWILMDFDEIMIHILNKEEAEFYELGRVWGDAERIEL